MADEKITLDPLFKGLTRPTMKWGVTYEYLFFNVFGIYILAMLADTMSSLLLALPIHVIGMLVCMNDPTAFNDLWQQARMRQRMKNIALWKASFYDSITYEE